MPQPVFKESKQKPYRSYWNHYFDFKSSSSRSQYWWPTLWNLLIGLGLIIIGLIITFSLMGQKTPIGPIAIVTAFVLLGLFSIATIIPSIAVTVRRYHDVGISGWWYLLMAGIPICIKIYDNSFENTLLTIIYTIFILANLVILVLPTNKISSKYNQ